LDLAMKHPLTHGVVNGKTTHSMYASLILVDLLAQLVLILGLTFITTGITWFIKGDIVGERDKGDYGRPGDALWWLYTGLAVSFARMGLEVAASILRNNFRAWCTNFWNLLNVVNLLVVTTAVAKVVHENLVVTGNETYYLFILAVGIQWIALVTILRTANLPLCIIVTGALVVSFMVLSLWRISYWRV
jgi:hypothetical protein